MSYLEELLPEFRKGAKIRRKIWDNKEIFVKINECGEPVLNNGNKFEFCKNITCSDWELYQEPVDWDYIIKNRCLCWFWDEGELPIISKLVYFDSSSKYKFTDERNHDWENCRPIRRDEVTFYEGGKNVAKG